MEGYFGVRKGAWTEEEDIILRRCIEKDGEGKWHQVPSKAGLNRCRKSCRLRWLNYLKPNIKRGNFAADEVDLMIRLHGLLGNRWSLIAGRLPGRTPNDVKNYWNTHLRKKLIISPIVDMEEKAKNIVKTKVIRPQPRTFCKNMQKYKPSTIKESFQPRNDVTNISPTTLMLSKNGMKYWWECLFDDKEVGDAIATCPMSSTDRFDEELNTTPIWTDDGIASAAKVGGTFDEDGFSVLANFSFDASLWDFLNNK